MRSAPHRLCVKRDDAISYCVGLTYSLAVPSGTRGRFDLTDVEGERLAELV
jgi:hypothetical protein